MKLDDLRSWVIHALGGVTSEEWERGLRLPRPIKAMLADINIHIARDRLESMFRLGHLHQAEEDARASAWIDLARQVPFPQQAPDSAPKEDTGLMRVTGIGHLPPMRQTGDLARLAAIKRAERRQG